MVVRAKFLVAAMLCVSGLAAMTGVVAARPVLPAEQRDRPYTGVLPSCADADVLATITSRFQQKESEYWNSDRHILAFSHVHQSGYRTNGVDYIPRRYCTAWATVDNDRPRHHHLVVYSIGEGLGWLGYGYGVNWCVTGYDRNYAYAPWCHAARH